MPLYARKRDGNEREIINALEALGCFVIQENNIDLYVFTPSGEVIPMEVKTSKGKLTPYQKNLHGSITEFGHTVYVVRSVSEALALVESDKHDRA
jgi:hypothetical protein